MCGLAGVASTQRRNDELARKDSFRQMLEVASWRGKDATGVACVRLDSLKAPAIVFKRAIKASDYIELEHWKRLERNFDEYGIVIGHARSSTSDGWNMADANAHPFQYGPITLVHNGTIRNCRGIDSGITHPVDSAHVAAALVEQGPEKLLPRLMGGFALVWHDARDGSLNFAKNPEKPLFWCYIKGENTMFWGSELEAIYAVLHRHEFEIDGKFRLCSSYTHFKFTDMYDLREFTRTPFGKPPSAPNHTHTQVQGAAWKEETRRLAGLDSGVTHCGVHTAKSESTQKQEKSTKGTETATTSGSQTDTELIGENEKYVPPKDSLRPVNRRKLRAVSERLLQFGRKIDTPICFTPELWNPYKNQRSQRGSITGHDRTKKQKFQIGNITKDIWGQSLKAGRIYGRIVNVKRDGASGWTMVCDYAPDLMDRFVFKTEKKSSPEVLDAGKPFPESLSTPHDTVGDAVQQTLLATCRYVGPGDRKYTEAEYLRLVKYGCAFCSRDLSPEDHETVIWVGPHQQSPVCEVCAASKEVRVSLGVHDGA